MGRMTRFSECVPLDPGDSPEEWDDCAIRRLIVCTIEQQGGYLYLARFLQYAPVLQQTSNIEF